MIDVKVILFDLGGVVVEQSGVETLHTWMNNRFSTEQIWHYWTHSPEVHAFECGTITKERFAEAVIRDLSLPVSISEFVDEFASWPVGLFPDAKKDLLLLAEKYTLACYTNTNELHWPRLRDDFAVHELFHHCYASHEVGLTKPSKEAFLHVCTSLEVRPENILFFDDNAFNVRSANELNVHAHLVQGWTETKRILTRICL